MPIVRQPNPLPSELDYIPPKSTPHKVASGDSWWTLADLPDVVASGMSASDLCHFNFKTRKGSEINWYLREKVGCRRTTRDGNNYTFSIGDSPGIVYLPKLGAPPPVNEYKPEPVKLDTRIWVGLAVKSGTQQMSSGQESMMGFAISVDNTDRWMIVNSQVTRPGFGFGVSGGLAVLIVSGVTRPAQLNGHSQSELDFNVSIGGNLGKAVKTAVAGGKYAGLINFIRKVGAKTPSQFRKALLDDPDKIAELVKLAKANKEAWGLESDKPNVLMFDIPLAGAGGELSIFYATSTYTAFGFGDD
ncbi:MAG TPA: hypothetical protein VMP03_13155 [Methylomirabilota bacterium]|nr:hypothetical protein [Methylomirabilota bacterium]